MFFDKDTQFSVSLVLVVTNSQIAILAFYRNYLDCIKRRKKNTIFSKKCLLQNAECHVCLID